MQYDRQWAQTCSLLSTLITYCEMQLPNFTALHKYVLQSTGEVMPQTLIGIPKPHNCWVRHIFAAVFLLITPASSKQGSYYIKDEKSNNGTWTTYFREVLVYLPNRRQLVLRTVLLNNFICLQMSTGPNTRLVEIRRL